jgi:hypothetical protein
MIVEAIEVALEVAEPIKRRHVLVAMALIQAAVENTVKQAQAAQAQAAQAQAAQAQTDTATQSSAGPASFLDAYENLNDMRIKGNAKLNRIGVMHNETKVPVTRRVR